MAAQSTSLLDSPPPDAPLHLSAIEPTLELGTIFYYLPLCPLYAIGFIRNISMLFAAVNSRAYGSATAATEYALRRREQRRCVCRDACSVDAVASAVAMDSPPSVSRFISPIHEHGNVGGQIRVFI